MPSSPQEPPESIVLQSFSGIRNTVAPERLLQTELEAAVNIDLDDAGQARRRRGFTKRIVGNFHSVRDMISGKTFGVQDGVLGIIRPGWVFASLGIVVGAGPVCYACVDGETYFSSASAQGVVDRNDVVQTWGHSDEQGSWWSPVVLPTDTLGAISGQLLGDPQVATSLEAYNGRIYMARGKYLWATELFRYHYVDRTANFMQFEHDITLLAAMDDGIYVGTTGGLYFLKGRMLKEFALSKLVDDPVLPGSGVWVPTDMVHPQAANGPIPTGLSAVVMTEAGVCACMDGGTVYNLTQGRVALPRAVSAAALFRQQDGANTYIAVTDSRGTPTAAVQFGDYADAEIVRFQGG